MFRGYTLRNRMVIFFLMVLSTLLIGAIGYVYIKTEIEGGHPTLIDALYWTVVTISTLGYSNSDINLTSQAGKLFSIFMIVAGVFIIFVGIEMGLGPWFEYKMRGIMEKKSPPVPEKGHVIVAGLSEIGEESAEELIRRGIPVVLIDPEGRRGRNFLERGIPVINGEPSREETLRKANIGGARAILLTSDDTTNAFIALTARHLNPEIRISASVSEKSSEKILRNSGAGSITLPEVISGEMLASKVMGEEGSSRDIDGFAHLYQISAEKYGLVGKSMGELHRRGMFPVGIRRHGDFIPFRADVRLQKGDVLTLIGDSGALKRMRGVGK